MREIFSNEKYCSRYLSGEWMKASLRLRKEIMNVYLGLCNIRLSIGLLASTRTRYYSILSPDKDVELGRATSSSTQKMHTK